MRISRVYASDEKRAATTATGTSEAADKKCPRNETRPHKIKYSDPFGFRRVCSQWRA